MSYRIVHQDRTEKFLENQIIEPIELLLEDDQIIQIYVYDENGIQIEFYEQI